jgi:hypothetical protein
MKCRIPIAEVAIALFVLASGGASAEPVLMLNEPRDIGRPLF